MARRSANAWNSRTKSTMNPLHRSAPTAHDGDVELGQLRGGGAAGAAGGTSTAGAGAGAGAGAAVHASAAATEGKAQTGGSKDGARLIDAPTGGGAGAIAPQTDGRDDAFDDDLKFDTVWRKPTRQGVLEFLDDYHPRTIAPNGRLRRVPLCASVGRHCCAAFACCDPCCEGHESQVEFLGVGVSAYFKWVKALGWVCFWMSVVMLPMVLINYGDDLRLSVEDSELGLTRTTLANLGPVANNTAEFPLLRLEEIPYVGDMGGLSDVSLVLSRQQVAVLYSVCDLLACVVFLFGICIMTSSEEDDIRSAAASIITSDQYSVRIKKVPADATRQQLVLLMEQVTGERVVDVVIASDSNSSTSLLVRRGKLLGRRERHYQHVQLLRSKLASGAAGVKERDRVNRRIGKHIQAVARVNERLRDLHDRWQERREVPKRSVNAFVTFDTVRGRDYALEAYPRGFCFWACQPRRLRLNGRRLSVVPAPLPSAILWENLAIRKSSRLCRRLVTLLISFGLLAMSAALMYAIRTQQVDVQATSLVNIDATCNSTTVFNADTPVLCNCTRESYSFMAAHPECHSVLAAALLSLALAAGVAVVVVGVNSLFGSMMEWMAAYERHLVTDKMAAAAFRGLFARQFFNTAILVVLINSDVGALLRVFGVEDITKGLAFGSSSLWDVGIPWYGSVGTPIMLSTALSVISFQVSPLFRCSVARCKRRCRCCCCCKTVMTQYELNRLYLGHRFKLHRRYARYMNQFMVAFMFCAGMPIIMWIALTFCIIGFWFDKIWLLRMARKPPQYNATMARLVRDLYPYALALHLAMACVMLGNSDILVTEELDSAALRTSDLPGAQRVFDLFVSRFLRVHTLPIFVCLLLVLLYIVLGQFCGVLGIVCKVLTCGQLQRHRIEEDAMAADLMTFTKARSEGYLHGQETYHFIDSAWYQQRLHFTREEEAAFRESGGVAMAFTLDQFIRDGDKSAGPHRGSAFSPSSGGEHANAQLLPGGRVSSQRRQTHVDRSMALQRSVEQAGGNE